MVELDRDHQPQPIILDAWVCRIPNTVLKNLAADNRLHNRERVLIALVIQVYSNRAPSVPRLMSLTSLDRRTVRRELDHLKVAGVISFEDAKPGQTRRWSLTGGAASAPGRNILAPQGALHLRQKGGATSSPPSNEQEGIVLKKGPDGKLGRYDKRTVEKYVFVGGVPKGEGEPT